MQNENFIFSLKHCMPLNHYCCNGIGLFQMKKSSSHFAHRERIRQVKSKPLMIKAYGGKMPNSSLLQKLECNINISHAHGGLLYIDRDNKSESHVPIEKLSTLVHQTTHYVVQERKHTFLVHDPFFYSSLEELSPCPNDQIRAASIDFYTSISNQPNQFASLVFGGAHSIDL